MNSNLYLSIPLTDINNWTKLDNVCWKISKLSFGQHIAFNLKGINFLNPSGILMLFLLCMEVNNRTSEKVKLLHVNSNLQRYLKRVKFYDYDFAYSDVSETWWSWPSLNLDTGIQLSCIDKPHDVGELAEKTKKILYKWFPSPTLNRYRDKAITVLMEMCNNSIEHSSLDNEYGTCYCTIQKYNHMSGPCIFIAVGDLGIGIRQHLVRRYRWICNTDAEYIKEAIAGRSGRLDGTGGLGLRMIKEITSDYRGNLIIRSGKGAILVDNEVRSFDAKHGFPGTQCTIILRPETHLSYRT